PDGGLTTRLVLDDNWPIPALGQAIGKKPSSSVESSTGRNWHDDAHGLLRPLIGGETGTRPTSAAEDRKNEGRYAPRATHGSLLMQQTGDLSVGQLHSNPWTSLSILRPAYPLRGRIHAIRRLFGVMHGGPQGGPSAHTSSGCKKGDGPA